MCGAVLSDALRPEEESKLDSSRPLSYEARNREHGNRLPEGLLAYPGHILAGDSKETEAAKATTFGSCRMFQ